MIDLLEMNSVEIKNVLVLLWVPLPTQILFN